MAANAPTILYPAGSETGIRFDRLIVQKDAYSGTGSQSYWQIQVATAGTFAAAEMIHDTLKRASLTGWIGDDWMELFPGLWTDGAAFSAGDTLHMRARVVNDSAEVSSWSSTVTFTMEADTLSSSVWEYRV